MNQAELQMLLSAATKRMPGERALGPRRRSTARHLVQVEDGSRGSVIVLGQREPSRRARRAKCRGIGVDASHTVHR
jgi:hypothetical protein